MSVVAISTKSQVVWSWLENTFIHKSNSRELRLIYDLQTMKKGDNGIPEFSRDFKAVCDQHAAMGRPVNDLNKFYWYLHGLGSSSSTFFTTH